MHPVDSVSSGAIVVIRDRLMEMQAAGKPIFRLESGDPNFSIEPVVAEAINDAIRRGNTHYTQSAGIPQLRITIAEKLERENKIKAESEQVVVTSGGMHALYLTFCSLLDVGDEVIIPDPMWTEIAENVKLAGGVPVRVSIDLSSESGVYPTSVIQSVITSRTKAIFVNTPHNPTGTILSRDNLTSILELAQKHNLKVISDEAYEHLVFDGNSHISIGSLEGAEDRVISIFSTSKSYAMSGLRVGYIHSKDRKFLGRVTKLLRCTTNGVSSISQWGAIAAIKSKSSYIKIMKDEYQQRRGILFAALSGSQSFKPILPSGGFFLWTELKDFRCYGIEEPDWDMTNMLIDSLGVGSAPGSAFSPLVESKRFIRFSFSGSTDSIIKAAHLLGGI